MGFYLSKPNKDKASSFHENSFLKCGASSMQGWRKSQEDAHNCCLDFDSDVSLFAVYDGHGGAEVAEYASQHLPNIIKETPAYKEKDFNTALKDAFLRFDATLVTEPVMEELKKIAGSKVKTADTDDEEDPVDDVQCLREEAQMPIKSVMARYKNGIVPKTPAMKRIAGESSKSPYLRAPTSNNADSEVSSSSGGSSCGVVTGNDVCQEAAGSSSSRNGESDAALTGSAGSDAATNSDLVPNGLPEPTSNGDAAVQSTTQDPQSEKVSDSCDVVSSSSPPNGESPTSSGKLSKRDRTKVYRSILAAVTDALDETDSEDENDENYCVNADTSTNSSDEEDVEENGEGEEEEESDDEDDDEEDEEEDDEEELDVGADLIEDCEEPGKDSGCTAVVSLVTKDRVIVANAGDSRAVLSRKGKAVDLSFDHKPEDPIELNRIINAGGKVTSDGRVNGGLNLSRALGDHMYKKSPNLAATEQMITALPDIKSIDLKEGEDEFIVLACDGIWNSMSSQQVVDFIRPLIAKGEPLADICEKLFDSCLAENTLGDGTGCDNMTCVIVRLFPHCDISGSKRKSEESHQNDDESNKRVKVDDAVGGDT